MDLLCHQEEEELAEIVANAKTGVKAAYKKTISADKATAAGQSNKRKVEDNKRVDEARKQHKPSHIEVRWRVCARTCVFHWIHVCAFCATAIGRSAAGLLG